MRISDWGSDVCSSDLINVFGLSQLVGAFPSLTPERVQKTDLHVDHDALPLEGMQVIEHRDWRGGASHQRLPQRHAHGRTVMLAPAKNTRLSTRLNSSH